MAAPCQQGRGPATARQRCLPGCRNRTVRRLVGCVMLLAMAGASAAQTPSSSDEQRPTSLPSSEPTSQVTSPMLTVVPERKSLTAEELNRFVDSLSTKDGTFDVIVGEGRVLTLKEDIAIANRPRPVVAVGDPSVIDIAIIGPRQIRIIGQRIGATDLTITTSEGKVYAFDVQAVADLDVLRYQLKTVFPDANLRVAQIRGRIVVEGQARDNAEVSRIIETIRSYLPSPRTRQSRPMDDENKLATAEPRESNGDGGTDENPTSAIAGNANPPIVNLIRVIGSRQVLLKVLVAELNRTALREIGAEWLGGCSGAGNTTAFGIVQKGDWENYFRALQQNSILRTLAEPNLVTVNGHPACFLAGGEFPVPATAAGPCAAPAVQFREFGVRLLLLPAVFDGDVIRLTVDAEVSNIEGALSTSVVECGLPLPGLSSRKAHTTVELRHGQTLMIAGLIEVTLDGHIKRIPCLGDLPVLGSFFCNVTSHCVEKELVVLVTPCLLEPLASDLVPPIANAGANDPNDLEAYFFGRMTPDPIQILQRASLERKYIVGPCGFSDDLITKTRDPH